MEKIAKRDLASVEGLIHCVLHKENYTQITRLGGLTNRTYKVDFSDGQSYVIRLPGEGTEAMINRADEKVSTMLACKLQIDAQLLYFGELGEKVTVCIRGAETLSADTISENDNLVKAAKILHKLHSCGEDTNIPFDVFDMAASYEKIIQANAVPLYADYDAIKNRIMEIKQAVDNGSDVKSVPCHNDPLCENWVLDEDGRLYLIDWEYAGMNDGMWDLADVSIEASLTKEQEDLLLEAYFDRQPTKEERYRFHANKLYLDYLWTLWGKARVPFDGESMETYATERYIRLKENLNQFQAL